MHKWDKLSRQQQERLRSLQIAREDQWKEDALVAFRNKSCEHNPAVNNVIDEHSAWFAQVVEEYMNQLVDESRERSRMPEWMHQVWNLGPERLAYVVVRSVIQASYSSAIFHDDNIHTNKWALPKAQQVARDIADQCWDLAAWLAAKKQDPFFYRHQSKYFKNWSTKRRRAFSKKVDALPKAPQRERDNFGHAMIRLALDSGLLIAAKIREIQTQANRLNKIQNALHIYLNADLVEYLHTKIDDHISIKLLPNRFPLVCRPIDHLPNEAGGFVNWHLRGLRKTAYTRKRKEDDFLFNTGSDFIDNVREVDPSCMSDRTRRVINTLQRAEWKINETVLDIVNDLWKANREVGNIPAYDPEAILEMPAYPEDGTPTEKHEWMAEKSRRWAKAARGKSDRLQMSLRMKEAYRLKSFTIYHAYFCDFRGRYYSDSYLLHPQGADLDKALIMAAEPASVTVKDLYWIKVNLANLMGVDKVSFDERVQYVDERMDDWRAIAADPHGTTDLWEDDAPKKNATFQRLAAIFDLLMAIDEGKTQVPVQIDGSCNGIQHWAAMTRDEVIGPEVNLTPGSKPADVYQLVANGCTDMCTEDPNDWRTRFIEHYQGVIPRKVVKRSVMCDPYGISDHSVREYVLQEKHLDWCMEQGLNVHAATAEMGTLICSSKARMMEHCNHGKKFVQLLCGWASGDEEDKPFSWYTPSGFLVINRYNKKEVKPSSIKVWDKDFQLQFQLYTKEYDLDSACTAMPPNFVHSLDAAHMSLVVDRLSNMGIEFFSMVHDSYGVLAPFVPMLREVTKETFHEIHSVDRLAELKARAEDLVGAKLPEQHPAKQHEQRGSLDIDLVLQSEYLFG